jgi:outer membrane protein insertion porin family
MFSVDFKRNSVLDNDGNHSLFDAYGAPATFSGTKCDTALAAQMRFTYGGPNAAQLMLSAEQALPVQPQWLNYTRMVAKAKRSFNLLSLGSLPGPLQLVLSSKGGSVVGDLPPYEAFAIGGTSSVRGYNDGAIGTGRKYVVGSAEMRVPVTPTITGAAFFDYGSDLHSGSSVLGDPAGTRGKPGSGYSYGVAGMFETGGLPIRFDYAKNDQGNARFHFSLARDFN